MAERTTTPVEDFLAEQARLQTPVARLAAHGHGSAGDTFAELIPLSSPPPGSQYAFEVDLDLCTGCKACVAACHALNGLDDHETWRDIGAITGISEGRAFVQTVTSACHHCEDPGCLTGCPVLAYEKDPATGIVRHLDDQCIGCSYCIMKCPYDVPKYSARLGIVRKCDMCSSRLAHGEAPACVQACPTQAIRITTVATGEAAFSPHFLPQAPDPSFTRPTTRYLTSRPSVAWQTPPSGAPVPEPAHWPLVAMTTLLGFGVGTAAAATATAAPVLWRVGAIAGLLGLLASAAHLGQPLRAWRIVLGIRRSWMSREAILLGIWVPAAAWLAFAAPGVPAAGLWRWLVVALGAAVLTSSMMIYQDTPRPFWSWRQGAPRFFGGAAALGCAAAVAILPLPGFAPRLVLACALVLKCAAELSVFRAGQLPLEKSRLLLRGPLRRVCLVRYSCAASALALLCAHPQPLRLAGLVLLLLAEGAERLIFFRAAAAPRMPGVGPT